jgi:hypothetical protein
MMPAKMTEARALRAVLYLRQAVADMDKGELSPGAFDIILRNELWPQEITDEDVAFATAEALRIAPLIEAEKQCTESVHCKLTATGAKGALAGKMK